MESELYKKDIGEIDMILYIISLLRNYDQKSCEKTNKCKINPYKDILFYTTNENKKIKISKDLQQQVIIQWKLMNSQENDKHEYDSTISGMFVEIMLCILVLIMMIYLFSMAKHIIKYI